MAFASIAHNLVTSGVPVAEKLLRTLVVYLVIVMLLRLIGKRDLAQLNSLDLVVLLLLSNVVQNALIGNDNSLTGGLIGAATLLVTNEILVALAQRYGEVRRLLEGSDTLLIHKGELDERALRRERLRPEEIATAVRRQGGSSISEVELATLKPGGTIDITLKARDVNATRADVERIERKLDQVLAASDDRRTP
jgi:uncharacterized membrane protein YcaP (DUF421 family)